jgi:hypothetical protein
MLVIITIPPLYNMDTIGSFWNIFIDLYNSLAQTLNHFGPLAIIVVCNTMINMQDVLHFCYLIWSLQLVILFQIVIIKEQ